MPLMPLISLLLPWEVIERVIENAGDDLTLLRSFSLTCRQLRPRSFSLMIAQFVFLNSRDRASNFCDFLSENTELQPLIHSIIVSPADFRPFPLINMLPCLSTLLFVSPGYKGEDDRWERPTLMLHTTILSSYHSFGKRIRNLSLDRVSFSTSCDLFRFVLAFPQIKEIVCHDIIIDRPETKGTSTLELMRSKLCNRLGLETLNVRQYPQCAMHMPAFQMIKC